MQHQKQQNLRFTGTNQFNKEAANVTSALVGELLKRKEISNITWYALSENQFMLEVKYTHTVISYEMLSSLLQSLRSRLGEQAVSRFYDFSAGTLHLAVTPQIKAQQRERKVLDHQELTFDV